MTGVLSVAHAQEKADTVKKEEIQTSIQNIIKSQIKKGLFSEKSEINIKIVEPTIVKKYDREAKKDVEKEEYNLTENHSTRLSNICKIELSFDNKGGIPYLGEDKQLMDLTKFTNENQKDIARKFVALHEQSHCEFSAIKDPIKFKNSTNDFNETSNQFLKDFEVMNLNFGSGGDQLNYITTLNESYADVSAMTILIKEYGYDNPDLKYVLKAIEVQRNDNYLQNGAEVHNTHVSIKNLLNTENLEKIKDIKSKEKFQEFALSIANEGVQNLMTQRKDFTEKSLTSDNFLLSIMINMVRIAKEKGLTNEEKQNYSSTSWKEGIEAGLTYKVAQEFLKDVDTSKYNFEVNKKIEGKKTIDPIDFVSNVMFKDPTNKIVLETLSAKFKDFSENFKAEMYKNNESKIVDFDSAATKAEIMKRVSTLRNQFLKETQSIQNNMQKP